MSKLGEVLAECIAEQSNIQVSIVQDDAPARIRIVFKQMWGGQTHSTYTAVIKAEDRERLAQAIMPPVQIIENSPITFAVPDSIATNDPVYAHAAISKLAKHCVDAAISSYKSGTLSIKDDIGVIKNRAYREACTGPMISACEEAGVIPEEVMNEITRLVDEAAAAQATV